MKILIFKSDRVGDFLNISSILKNLYDQNHEIDVVCSKYNYQIAKYYKFIKNFYIKKNILIFFIKNKNLLFKKYDIIYQLDGSNSSFQIGFIIGANQKYAIKYIKKKKILGIPFYSYRPNYFLRSFYNLISCVENYNVPNNKEYHYLNLYLKLIKLSGIQILKNDHYFPINYIKDTYNINLYEDFILIHFDIKWKNYDKNYFYSFKNKIIELSTNNKIIITSDQNNILLEDFKDINNDIRPIYNTNIDELIYIIKKSKIIISSHSGLAVHLAACLKKKIIDIIPINKFNELERWIPINTKYERIELEKIKNVNLINLCKTN